MLAVANFPSNPFPLILRFIAQEQPYDWPLRPQRRPHVEIAYALKLHVHAATTVPISRLHRKFKGRINLPLRFVCLMG